MVTALIENFTHALIHHDKSDLKMITIYKNPKDFPGKYVARLFINGKATIVAMVKDDIEEIRELLPCYCIPMQRSLLDDPVIVETWIM